MIVRELFARLGLKVDNGSFDRGSRAISGLRGALTGLLSVATFEGVRRLVQGVADAADEIDKSSQAAGVSVAALQQLRFAAQLGGASAEQMGIGLRQLSKNIADVARGSGEAKDAFRELGIRAKENGKLLESEEALSQVADRFAEMEDGTRKTALAMRIFGESGAALIPTLNQGREGIAALREEFTALGGELSEETVKAFAQLNDDQTRLRAIWTGMKNTIAIELLPAMQRIVTTTIGWFKENGRLISQGVLGFLKGLADVLRGLAFGFEFVIDLVKDFTKFLGINTDGVLQSENAFRLMRIAAIALGVVMTAVAIRSAIAWGTALAPLLLIGAAVTAVILIVEDLWTSLTGGQGLIIEVFDRLSTAAADAIFFMLNDFSGFFDWVTDKVADLIGFIASIPERLSGIRGDIVDFLDPFDLFGDDTPTRPAPTRPVASTPPVPLGGQSVANSSQITVNVDGAGREGREIALDTARAVERVQRQSLRRAALVRGGA